jgi:HTH-type transcriptional regulator/antitoxin HigA
MRAKSRYQLKGKGRDSYLELVLAFPLASIGSDAHLAEASRVLDRLSATGSLDEGQATYFEALCDLVESYEDEHHRIEPAPDADLLRHLLEARGISQAQLSAGAGLPKSSISAVLSGKKPFSRQMIRKLAEFFQLHPSVLAANF